jgi:mannosyltransferase OCH1-like enzyme
MRRVRNQSVAKLDELTHDEKPGKPKYLRIRSLLSWRRGCIGSRRCLFVVCLLFACFLLLLSSFRHALFGHRSSHRGGMIGVLVDLQVRDWVFRRTISNRDARLERLGIRLPPWDGEKRGNAPSIPQNTLAKTITKIKHRSHLLRRMESFANDWEQTCQHDKSIDIHSILPQVIHQPVTLFRPAVLLSADVVLYEESDMRQLLTKHFVSLLDLYDSLSSHTDRIHLWSICALYWYGGYFFGRTTRVVSPLMQNAIDMYVNTHKARRTSSESNDFCWPKGIALFEERGDGKFDIAMLAFTPRHKHLQCLVTQLESARNSLDAATLLSKFFLANHRYREIKDKLEDDTWHTLTSSWTPQADDNCWDSLQVGPMQNVVEQASTIQHNQANSVLIRVVKSSTERASSLRLTTTKTELNVVGDERQVTVEIQETSKATKPVKSPKEALQQRMNSLGLEPGWFCMRCLTAQLYGSFQACSKICQSYEKIMLEEEPHSNKREITIQIQVNDESRSHVAHAQRLIPRILHQTWFEEITPDRYPQLVRLQNSWRSSGWEYRFYTDKSARDYIVKNFPARFLDAFDALIPGAFKVRDIAIDHVLGGRTRSWGKV